MATTESATTDLQRFWLAHARAAVASGLTVKEYAAREGLERKKLYEWRRKFKQRGLLAQRATETRFAAVQVLATAPSAPVRIVFPNGLALELAAQIPEATLRQVLACLGWPR
jgi:transposase-like protein